MSERRRGKEEKQNVVHAGRGHGVGVGALLALASLLAVGGTTRERWPEETLRYEHQGAGLASLTNSRLLLRSGGRVAFPSYADGPLRIETPTGEALAFSLAGAAAHPRIVTNAGAAYRDVLGPGAHLWQQPVDAGIEDFLRFPRRPADEEVSYVLRPEGFAGLRLVANVLELLDPAGVPRLRMAPPYILDAAGTARQPQVSLHDCAYDADPRGPWGRPVVAPGAAACVVRIAWADQAVSYPAVLDPAWTTTGSMTVARKTHTATELPDGKVLVAGGESPTGAIFTSAELYDPASKTWSPTGNMNRPRQYFTATLVRVGGQPRVLAVAGGATATMEIASSETYDPAIGVWTLTAPDLEMKQIRRFHTASLLGDGRVLVAGGLVGQPGFAGGLTSIEIYDPMTGAWTKGSDLLAGRAGHTASVLTNGNVLITGGYKFGVDTFASTEVYDVANGTWANGATMAAGRAGHTATLLQNGQVLVVGGLSSGLNFLSTAELVKADGQQLIGTGSLANTRFTHTATLLPDGRVLAAGGQGSATEVVTKTEIYDPAKGVWLLAGNALQSRAFHTASRLFGEIRC